MRFQDFKLVEAPGDEVPAKKMANVNVASDTFDGDEVNDLQQQVADRVMRVQDPSVLHRVEAILRKGGITRISNAYFKRDSDAEKFVNRLATMIIELEIPTNDKIAFLKEFATKNCIIPEKIFDGTGTPQSMDTWFDGSQTARTMFKAMINDPGLIGKNAGEAGPGELAIACFHRKITAGTDPKASYDLKYGSDLIEVKTSAGGKGGGRWTAMNDYPLDTYIRSTESKIDPKKCPKSVSMFRSTRQSAKTLPNIVDVLSDPQYLKEEGGQPIMIAEQKQIFKRLLQYAYPNADDQLITKAASSYPNHTTKDIAPVAFASYKAKQDFTSMLLMKASGDNITTLHFNDLAVAVDKFKLGALYLNGQQRGMSMQATLV
ncbi:MAG: hypothetical protein ACKVJK_05710 [Methylophagaceae bacterium]|jgi:hypothetical protein|tara:strand:+ start:28 stop:1152 length:1125 start_codon:yes stop_codon:yes gene_type:complete